MTPVPDPEDVMMLPERLDLSSVQEVADCLRLRVGRDLRLDAEEVTHLGGLGLQLLLASAKTWHEAGCRLRVSPRSAALDAALAAFGVSPDQIETGGPACP